MLIDVSNAFLSFTASLLRRLHRMVGLPEDAKDQEDDDQNPETKAIVKTLKGDPIEGAPRPIGERCLLQKLHPCSDSTKTADEIDA